MPKYGVITVSGENETQKVAGCIAWLKDHLLKDIPITAAHHGSLSLQLVANSGESVSRLLHRESKPTGNHHFLQKQTKGYTDGNRRRIYTQTL